MAGWDVAVGFPNKSGIGTLLSELDRRVLEFGGRLLHRQGFSGHRRHLPCHVSPIDEWIAVRRRVDPLHVFTSDMARRLELH
jgi:decaprenylphospho-beta-D-ribofuranose 2-oxidase